MWWSAVTRRGGPRTPPRTPQRCHVCALALVFIQQTRAINPEVQQRYHNANAAVDGATVPLYHSPTFARTSPRSALASPQIDPLAPRRCWMAHLGALGKMGATVHDCPALGHRTRGQGRRHAFFSCQVQNKLRGHLRSASRRAPRPTDRQRAVAPCTRATARG